VGLTWSVQFTTPYEAILLTNGSVYFGHLQGYGGPSPILSDVYYIVSQTNPDDKQVNNEARNCTSQTGCISVPISFCSSFVRRACRYQIQGGSIDRSGHSLALAIGDVSPADELLDDSSRKEPRDFLPSLPLGGSATECDGLVDLPCARTVGTSSRHAPALSGKARDKLRVRASTAVVSRAFDSRGYLHGFYESGPLRLWEAEHNPS